MLELAPFAAGDPARGRPSMGMGMHFIPQVHVLFVGPVECARHTFAPLVDDPDASMLVVDDVQTSLGLTEDLVCEAAAEICACNPQVRAFVICTGCRGSFLGMDFEGLCRRLGDELSVDAVHFEANRLSRDNTPGTRRADAAGGDRFHAHTTLMGLLARAGERQEVGETPGHGLLMLADEPLSASNELPHVVQATSGEWVRSLGDMEDYACFEAAAHARFALSTAIVWDESLSLLEDRLKIPALALHTSYALDVVERHYWQLAQHPEGIAPPREERARAQTAVKEALRALDGRPFALNVAALQRPWSAALALLDYGFSVHHLILNPIQARHVERDDAKSYDRLVEYAPDLMAHTVGTRDERFAPGPGKRQRHGRWKPPAPLPAVTGPKEGAYWGYASIRAMMEQLIMGAELEELDEEPVA